MLFTFYYYLPIYHKYRKTYLYDITQIKVSPQSLHVRQLNAVHSLLVYIGYLDGKSIFVMRYRRAHNNAMALKTRPSNDSWWQSEGFDVLHGILERSPRRLPLSSVRQFSRPPMPWRSSFQKARGGLLAACSDLAQNCPAIFSDALLMVWQSKLLGTTFRKSPWPQGLRRLLMCLYYWPSMPFRTSFQMTCKGHLEKDLFLRI